MSNQTTNQWAFAAITGYELPGAPFGSAEAECARDGTLDELIAEAEAQVEFFAPDGLFGELDARAVADAVLRWRDPGPEHEDERYQIYLSLGEQ